MCAGWDKALGWYSDNLAYELLVSDKDFQPRAPNSLSEIPAEDPLNPGTPLFLSADDPWLVAMQQVRPQLPTLSGSVALAFIQCSLLLFSFRSVVSSTLLSSWLRDAENWQRRTHVSNAVAPCTTSGHERRS
jgi:hypothetical protein